MLTAVVTLLVRSAERVARTLLAAVALVVLVASVVHASALMVLGRHHTEP
jgi:hypothetical protein